MKRVIDYILDFIKGILLGFICVATPGVSGGTIAVIIGLFDKIVLQGNELFKNVFKKSWWKVVLFFVCLLAGVAIGALIGSKVVTFTYNLYPLATTLCIMGLIVGSIPYLFKSIKSENKFSVSNIILFVVVITLALCYTFLLSSGTNVDFTNLDFGGYLLLTLMGIISVITMIIPGISGSIFLMSFGYYFPLNETLSNIFSNDILYTLPIIISFGIGCVIGAFLVIKVIKILLDKFEVKTKVAILGFVVASPIIMVKLCILSNTSFVYNTPELIVGIILFIVATIGSYLIGKLNNKKDR